MSLQRTVRDAVSVTGTGLQTGERVTLTLRGAPEHAGITFVRTDLPNDPSLSLQALGTAAGAPERRTTIGTGPLQVQTIEHLLAALAACGVTNCTVELDALELPGLDGSAAEYLALVRKAGVVEQRAPRPVSAPATPVWCTDAASGAFLAAFPADVFRVSYTLSYDCPSIGTQFFDRVIDEEVFARDIAPARTFCLEKEAEALLRQGLGKGANYENTLVMGAAGPVKNALRFPDEPVRHKVLDLIGDLYLTGMPLRAHVVAIRSGHSLNMQLVKRLMSLKYKGA